MCSTLVSVPRSSRGIDIAVTEAAPEFSRHLEGAATIPLPSRMPGRQFRIGDHRRDARFEETRGGASRRGGGPYERRCRGGQKAGEITSDVAAMDLARFLLNSLYGAILVSKAETTDRPMRLFLRLAFEPLLLQRRKP
jgi:hypothetical protein